MACNNSIYTQFVSLEQENVNISIKEIFYQNDKRKLAVFLQLNCTSAEDVLNIASQFWKFGDHYRWLIYDSNADIDSFEQNFGQKNVSIDADVIYAHPVNSLESSKETVIRFYDVYNNGKHIGGKLNMTLDRDVLCNDKNCKVKNYLSELYKRSKFGNRPTMTDVSLRVAVVITHLPLETPQNEILEFMSTEDNIILENIARFGYVTIRIMQDILKCNITYSFKNLWSESDHFGGVIGDICQHNADLISSPYLISKGRLDNSVPIMFSHNFRSVCVFRTPRNSGGLKNDVFFEPFSPTVWLMFSGAVLICALLLWFIFLVEHNYSQPSFLTTFVMTFGIACSQGSVLVPNSVGGRITFLTLALLCFMMYNYYTSIVVSSLLGSPVKSNIESITQLADSPLKVAMEVSAYTKTYLKTQPLPEIKHFVKRKVQPLRNPKDLWMPIIDGVFGIKEKPNFAYVFEASVGYYLVQRYFQDNEICDLNEINFRTGPLFQHVHRNSTYRDYFRTKMTRILETGVHNKHVKHWTRKQPSCFSNNNLIEVGIEYTASLFIFMICTYMIVVITLFIEICLHRYLN